MSRRILVKVTADGAITVEADGFRGSGCEAATKAIEDALGQTTGRVRKSEFRQQPQFLTNQQKLGNSGD